MRRDQKRDREGFSVVRAVLIAATMKYGKMTFTRAEIEEAMEDNRELDVSVVAHELVVSSTEIRHGDDPHPST
jgi:hypothetical protein